MKVIFLDIDGVLNTESFRESSNIDYFETPISENHMRLLAHLIKITGAKIVLSSTWREYWKPGQEQFDRFGVYINSLFQKYDLEIFDKTPELTDRDEEITEWKNIYKNELDGFVIIDDFDFKWSDINKNHLVKTHDEVGLDKEAVDKAIKILNLENI